MEVVEVACLLEVVGDHEVEMEGVETEVGLVEVGANQEEVLLEKKKEHIQFIPLKLHCIQTTAAIQPASYSMATVWTLCPVPPHTFKLSH